MLVVVIVAFIALQQLCLFKDVVTDATVLAGVLLFVVVVVTVALVGAVATVVTIVECCGH
jgi:hypothetical protein